MTACKGGAQTALLAGLTALAVALGAARANAGTLVALRFGLTSGNAAGVIMTFTDGFPTYKILGNGSNNVSLILAGTVRGLTPSTIAGTASLRSISIDTLGDALGVTFHETVRVNVTVAAGAGQTLIATLTPVNSAAAAPHALPAAAPPVFAPAAAAPSAPDNMEIVRLKYADVSEVVGLIVAGQQIPSNDSFTPQAQQFGSAGLTSSATGFPGGGVLGGLTTAGGAVPSQPQTTGPAGASLGQQINANIGIDRRLNAIVLSGPPDVIARYKAEIDLIDVPLSSVELEVQIVELDDGAAKDIGIDFTNAGGAIASATYTVKSLATGQGTLNLQAAVYAQIQKGLGRTIARPRITALDGTTAQIITGTQIPIVTSIAVSGVSAVSSQVQYINVGVSLEIQPRISPDGFVTSHIFSQVSSQTGTIQSYPELSQRQASTLATVRDGDSFVIGGLLQQNEISSVAKVPGFGDLPVIGGLFRVRHDSSQHTNLYIIVTPHILRNGANPPPPKPSP